MTSFFTRDVIATALVAATVVPYVGYVIEGDMPFIEDARGMAATGMVLGFIAWMVLGADAFGPRWLGVGGGLISLALGVTAAVLETGVASDVFLAAFIVSMIALWLVAQLRHTSLRSGSANRGIAAGHA